MAKKTMDWKFLSGSFYTDVVPVRFAHINQPDEEYDRYAITVTLDRNDPSTKKLFKTTLDHENACREEWGLDPVETPSNWLRKGKERKDDSGNWEITFQMKPQNSKGVDQSPGIANAEGDPDNTVRIWGGDKVVVAFGIAVWGRGDEAGSKYFLNAVQQVESSGGPGAINFANRAQAEDQEDAGTDDTDTGDIPF